MPSTLVESTPSARPSGRGPAARRAAARRILMHVEAQMGQERLDELAKVPRAPATTEEWHRLLLRRVFALGLSFVARARHLDATIAALGGGDPAALVNLTDESAAAFLGNAGVIRNARKLAAARHNAAVVVALAATYGAIGAYARALVPDGTAALLDDLRDRFRLVGPVSAARLAQELAVDVIVPHPAVVRTLRRLGWLDAPNDTEALQTLATEVAPRRAGAGPVCRSRNDRRARFGAVLLAFATGRWTRDAVCADEPACDRCPASGVCQRLGVES